MVNFNTDFTDFHKQKSVKICGICGKKTHEAKLRVIKFKHFKIKVV